MGLVGSGFEKMYAKRRQLIADEAAGAGSKFFAFEQSGSGSAGGLVAHAIRAKIPLVDQKVDGVQVFGFETQGVRHMYVQPWSGVHPLPGEHHAWLHGSFRSPIAFVRSIVGFRWDAGGDEELKLWLGGQPELTAAINACSGKWKANGGGMSLDCKAQLTSLGDGRAHLVQHAGHHGGLLGTQIGVREFLGLGATLAGLLPRERQPAQSPLRGVAYTEVFQRCLLSLDGQPPATTQARSYLDVVRAAGHAHESETFFVHDWPPEIDGNVRSLVLPGHERGAPIAAVLDLTALGSGKDAVVLTATSLYMRSVGDTLGFALEELHAVEPPKGLLIKTVKVTLKSGRSMKVQAGSDASALYAVLGAVSAQNQHGR